MWRGGSTPFLMRTSLPAGAGSGAGCSARPYGKPDFPAAAGIYPGHFAGPGHRVFLRSAAALPPPAAPAGPPAGRRICSGCGRRMLSLCAGPGGGRAAGICGAGRHRRRRAVFFRLLLPAAAGVGILGGYPGLSGPLPDLSPPSGEKIFKKMRAVWKKSLLFCRQMLYNRKKWIYTPVLQRRQQAWPKPQIPQKRASAPSPAC